ncbi:ATP-binding protein [Gordonia sp. CPCC 206044]|uniref:ATP-binding protein n=1 Tax=Gordonia sp. CPCC 206044 TaxID=3140793 RepID=UPI003AF340EB
MTQRRKTLSSRSPYDPQVPDLRAARLVLKEGFSVLAETAPPTRPDDLTMRAYRSLTDSARKAYDRQRREFHANFGPFVTPAVTTATRTLTNVYESNRFKRGDRLRGSVIMSAPAGLGKSTLVVSFAQQVFRDRRAENGKYTTHGNEYIPVAYISLTSNPTPRGIDALICDFYGAPLNARNEGELLLRARDCVLDCETELFIVDECQFVDETRPTDAIKTVNHLKSLVNMMPGTFIFVGTGLSHDEEIAYRGAAKQAPHPVHRNMVRDHILVQQMGRRWTPITFTGFTLTTQANRNAWEAYLLTMERDMVLCRKRPGMLVEKLSQYLFTRSSGHIGSLMSLIGQGIYRAVTSGEEQLTQNLLDTVTIDTEAERQRTAYLAKFHTGALSTHHDPQT